MEKESASECSEPDKEVRIEHYKRTGYWGVWLGTKMVAITIYKRGAEMEAELARRSTQKHSDPVIDEET